jgi:hypothetical protein
MTTTQTFEIDHPRDLSILMKDSVSIESNRQVLESVFPQFIGRQLTTVVYP